jgi:hypothetical protein
MGWAQRYPSSIALSAIVAALHPCEAPLHRSIAALHPCKAPWHRSIAALHPCEVPLHRSIAVLHPCTVSLHRSIAALHPCKVPLHRSIAALHPCKVPLHRCMAALLPCEAPLHRCIEALLPCKNLLHRSIQGCIHASRRLFGHASLSAEGGPIRSWSAGWRNCLCRIECDREITTNQPLSSHFVACRGVIRLVLFRLIRPLKIAWPYASDRHGRRKRFSTAKLVNAEKCRSNFRPATGVR